VKLAKFQAPGLLLLSAVGNRLSSAAPVSTPGQVVLANPDTFTAAVPSNITWSRIRQFPTVDATGARDPLFEASGARGPWLEKAADRLVAGGNVVRLGGLELTSRDDWRSFLQTHLGTRAQADAFAARFGVRFGDFARTLDNVAGSNATGSLIDLTPGSALSARLSLNATADRFALDLPAGATVELPGVKGSPGSVSTAQGVPALGPELLNLPGPRLTRARSEGEAWGDFVNSPGAVRIFRDNTGPGPFVKLTDPKWDDDEAINLTRAFILPLHLEMSGTPPEPQDNREMFRETYYRFLEPAANAAGISFRGRVRFDNRNGVEDVRRMLAQGKLDREINATRSDVYKFESRFEGNRLTETQLNAAIVTGKEPNGRTLAASQELYEILNERGLLPADRRIHLEALFILLQQRRRTHLQLDAPETLEDRRAVIQAEVARNATGGLPVDARATARIAQLDGQISLLNEMRDLLNKYDQWLISGETFISSDDLYQVYALESRDTRPGRLNDGVGLVDSGIHTEAEWDAASSDQFQRADIRITARQAELREALKGNPPNAPDLELELEIITTDAARLKELAEHFRADLDLVVKLKVDRLVDAGLELDPVKKSKDARAQEMLERSVRPTYWIES
jgi:hypothetical protein